MLCLKNATAQKGMCVHTAIGACAELPKGNTQNTRNACASDELKTSVLIPSGFCDILGNKHWRSCPRCVSVSYIDGI